MFSVYSFMWRDLKRPVRLCRIATFQRMVAKVVCVSAKDLSFVERISPSPPNKRESCRKVWFPFVLFVWREVKKCRSRVPLHYQKHNNNTSLYTFDKSIFFVLKPLSAYSIIYLSLASV